MASFGNRVHIIPVKTGKKVFFWINTVLAILPDCTVAASGKVSIAVFIIF